MVGAKNAAWIGGVSKQTDGYLYERFQSHPFASGGYVLQHRLVAERYLRASGSHQHFLVEVDGAMYLRRDLDVHHVNRDRTDNDPANLVVCTRLAHSLLHKGALPAQSDYWLAAPI